MHGYGRCWLNMELQRTSRNRNPENRCQHPALRCLNLLLHHILAITDRMIMGMQIEAMTIPILRRRL